MKTTLMTAFLGIALAISSLSQDAHAEGYSVTVWQNHTNSTVGGRYRWGDGPWTSFTILPGQQLATWFRQSTVTPPLQIRFDADPGPGRDERGYRLRTYYSPTTIFNKGATEFFVTLPNGRVDVQNTRA